MRWRLGSLITVGASLLAQSALAQDELPTFSSDRPGFANTPAIAAPHALTLETGLSLGFQSNETLGTAPLVSLRTGVLPWLELRAKAPNVVWGPDEADGTEVSMGDPNLGFKVGGTPLERIVWSSVWELGVPVGSSPAGGQSATFFGDFTVDMLVTEHFVLTPNAYVRTVNDGTSLSGTAVEGGWSLKFTVIPIKGLTCLAQYVLYTSEIAPSEVQLGGAVAYQFYRWLPQAQVDLGFDAGLDGGLPPTISGGATVLF